VPVTLEGEFIQAPIDQPRQKSAKRPRQVPVTLEGEFIQAPPQRPAKRGRKTAAAFELPFDPAPVPKRARAAQGGGAWDGAPGERRSPAAKRAKSGRAKPAAPNDDFNEDSIWPDL
jgi:hypothetical protein